MRGIFQNLTIFNFLNRTFYFYKYFNKALPNLCTLLKMANATVKYIYSVTSMFLTQNERKILVVQKVIVSML